LSDDETGLYGQLDRLEIDGTAITIITLSSQGFAGEGLLDAGAAPAGAVRQPC